MPLARAEIIFICNDSGYITGFGNEIVRAAKRVHFYLVVGRSYLAPLSPVRCYVGGKDLDASLFHQGTGDEGGLTVKLSLMADNRESLAVMEENGRLTGIFISPYIYAGYLSRKIIGEIQPAERTQAGT
jgi:hypothetical protein